MADTKKTKAVKEENDFTKQQLINSRKYAVRADMLSALLDDNKKYTFSEVEKMILAYEKKEVE